MLVDGQPAQVTIVELSQTVSVRNPKSGGGVTPNLSDTRWSGSYSMTMVRWLRNTKSGGWNWIDAGGETRTNVTAAQLHLKGRQFYGSPGNCVNGVLWYAPADAYNTTSLKGQVPYATGFQSGYEHCIRNGEHGARFPGYAYWHFYITGQVGPFKTW